MSKREVLEHIIDILYEQLLMTQINQKWSENEAEEVDKKGSIAFQSVMSQYMRDIDVKSRQIEIAKEMLKELKDE